MSHKVTVTKFFADWCSPCKAMKPDWDKLVAEYGDRVHFREVDTDPTTNPKGKAEVQRRKIMSVPVILFQRDGADALEHFGAMRYAQLKTHIDSLLI
jgi:thioredoxin 1